MKNIYITDLDHTFLRSDLSLSDYTKKIWNSYADEAILSVATARTYRKTMQFLDGVEINAPMILLDGALIATVDKKIIDTKFLSKEVTDRIIKEGGALDIYPFVLALEQKEYLSEVFLYPSQCNQYQVDILKRYVKEDNLQKQHNIRAMEHNFKVVYMDKKEKLELLQARLQKIFGDSMKYILAPEVYLGCYFLTLLHKDANKANGIKTIAKYSNFDVKNLSVFGDNFNDIEMFALAGKSIAVANAQDGVKAKASKVLKWSNDEDGVAKYLEQLREY